MPPFIDSDPAMTGEIYRALRNSGHGRRVAIVDASYNPNRHAEVLGYLGSSSARALDSIFKLVPLERDPTFVTLMHSDEDSGAYLAMAAFNTVLARHGFAEEDIELMYKDPSPESQGFYAKANGPDTLYIVTSDTLPFACATFVLGHSQIEL